MVVCVCYFDLLLLDRPDSLKGKRQVIKSLKERLRSRLSVSAAEVGSQDLLHRGELGVAIVGESREVLEPIAARIRGMIEAHGTVEILNSFTDYPRY
jgi:uncharacterized protein YlxP (DUF503 family)